MGGHSQQQMFRTPRSGQQQPSAAGQAAGQSSGTTATLTISSAPRSYLDQPANVQPAAQRKFSVKCCRHGDSSSVRILSRVQRRSSDSLQPPIAATASVRERRDRISEPAPPARSCGYSATRAGRAGDTATAGSSCPKPAAEVIRSSVRPIGAPRRRPVRTQASRRKSRFGDSGSTVWC